MQNTNFNNCEKSLTKCPNNVFCKFDVSGVVYLCQCKRQLHIYLFQSFLDFSYAVHISSNLLSTFTISFQRTVQAWIPEANFMNQTGVEILHPILWKLSAKIQLATQMKTQVRLTTIYDFENSLLDF